MAAKPSQNPHGSNYNYFSRALNRACRAEDFVNEGPNSWLLAGALMSCDEYKEDGLSKIWKDWAKKHPDEATIIRRGVAHFCLEDGGTLKPDLPPSTKTATKKLVISKPGPKNEAKGKPVERGSDITKETSTRKRQASECEPTSAMKRQKCEPKQESTVTNIPDTVETQAEELEETGGQEVVPEPTETEKDDEKCHPESTEESMEDSSIQATANRDEPTQGFWGNLSSFWGAVRGS
ncbi:hypothetical protein QQX98_004453 [Neonectria punicea]|uniref:Primase C-terminal 2 domain-containing protein n=1 Tax=Neonectria punicea TaxID=979145 RepID=A0ABR1H9U3_9HYPO